MSRQNLLWAIGIAVVVVVVIFVVDLAVPSNQSENPTASECVQDIECAKNRIDWSNSAESRCPSEIEDKARYDYRWTDGVLGDKFEWVRVSPAGTYLIYSGEELQFQNRFGAWERMSYSCSYDPLTGDVLWVRVEPL